MSDHTPGPWRYQKETTRVFGANDAPVTLYQVYKAEGEFGHAATCKSEANARLIAAAPLLLEAAESALQVFVDQGWDDDLIAASQLKAAIAKAKGGSQ